MSITTKEAYEILVYDNANRWYDITNYLMSNEYLWLKYRSKKMSESYKDIIDELKLRLIRES